jgi:hypothetical protein
MKTNLAGVDLFAMIYAWSQQRTTMVVSTCGKTIRHQIDYHSKFVDAFDNTTYKELPRPAVLHQTFHFLPLIDEANKERQSTLALEKKWLTKNCWTRVITSLVGESVVDMMRWDRHKRAGLPIIFRNDLRDFDISEMADMIAKPVATGGLGAVDHRKGRRSEAELRNEIGPLVRIRGSDNSIVHPQGRTARQMRCFMCRRYKSVSPNTVWCCGRCKMPLCSINRKRNQTCLEEHQCSTDIYLSCGQFARDRNQWVMPKSLKIHNRTRSSGGR